MPTPSSPARHPRTRIAWLWMLLLLVSSIGAGEAQAQEDPDAYLERFIRYARWPNETGVHHPWRLCVVGHAAATAAHFQNMTARNREILIVAPHDPSEISDCDLLDLRQVDSAHAVDWLNGVRGKPVLTIGNDAGFCTRGGHICFTHEGTPPFEINLSSAQESSLRISARLLARDPDTSTP